MKNNLILSVLICAVLGAGFPAALPASPLDPSPATEVVVYSPDSSAPLHVRGGDVTRIFPAAYNGHRAVCPVAGTTTNDTFCAWSGGDAYALGDPFGVSNGRDYPAIGLTRTTSIMPRIDVFADASDRKSVYGDFDSPKTNDVNFIELPKTGPVRVRLIRYQVDDLDPYTVGVREPTVLVDRVFQSDVRSVLHEGDLLAADTFDIDWDRLYSEVVQSYGIIATGSPITNVNYLVVFGDDSLDFDHVTATNNTIHAHPILVNRRFEINRTTPTPTSEVVRTNSVTVGWKILGEDPWAAKYGTTYTACKVNAWLGSTTNGTPWKSSGVIRMPPADQNGVYHYAIRGVPNNTNLTWQVFTYNSKFKLDRASTNLGYQYGGSDPRTVNVVY